MATPLNFSTEKPARYPVYLGDSIVRPEKNTKSGFAVVKYNHKPRNKGSARQMRIKSRGDDRIKLILKDTDSNPIKYTGRTKKENHILIYSPTRKAFILEASTEVTINHPSSDFKQLSLASSPEDSSAEEELEEVEAEEEAEGENFPDLYDSPYDFRQWLPGGGEIQRPADTESDFDDDVSELDERIVEKPQKVTNALGISAGPEPTVETNSDADRDAEEETDYLVIEGEEEDHRHRPRPLLDLAEAGLTTPAATPWLGSSSDDDADAESEHEPEPLVIEEEKTHKRPVTPPNEMVRELEDEIERALTPGMDIDGEELEAEVEKEIEEDRRRQQLRMAVEEESEEE